MKQFLLTSAMALLGFVGMASAQESLTEVNDLYMVGDPTGWSAYQLIKSSDHVWFYQGTIAGGDGSATGRFRCCTGSDSWWTTGKVHPNADKTLVTNGYEGGIEYNNMPDGDKNWYIDKDGAYRIVFNLEDAKVSVSTDFSEVLPVLTPTLYLVGTATDGGDDAAKGTHMTVDASDSYIFSGEVYLKAGDFKLSLRNDKGMDGNWIHPSGSDQEISSAGLADCQMDAFRGDGLNSYKWSVVESGRYKITLDLRKMKMNVEYVNDKVIYNQLYIVGDLTAWQFWNMTKVEPNVFEFTFENCEAGKRFRAAVDATWQCQHFRPEIDNTELAIDNTEGLDIKTDQTEDYNWVTKDHGTYKIRFDLNKMKVSANNDNTSTSITEVTMTDDEPEEYFTLQGIRVGNVNAGNIYILKKGSSVKKVIIR